MDVYHAVIEVRYAPTAHYLDTRGAIIEEFKAKYPELQVEDFPIGPPFGDLGKHVRLHSEQRGIKTFVNGVHTGFEMEFEPFDLDTFARESQRFCRTVIRDILKVESIARIGMRFWYRWQTPDGDLSNFMFHKMLQSTDDFSNIHLTGRSFRLGFRMADGDYGYTFQFYPEQTKEEEESIGFLVADFDVYQQDPPVTALTSLREIMEDAQKRVLELGTRLQKGIFRND